MRHYLAPIILGVVAVLLLVGMVATPSILRHFFPDKPTPNTSPLPRHGDHIIVEVKWDRTVRTRDTAAIEVGFVVHPLEDYSPKVSNANQDLKYFHADASVLCDTVVDGLFLKLTPPSEDPWKVAPGLEQDADFSTVFGKWCHWHWPWRAGNPGVFKARVEAWVECSPPTERRGPVLADSLLVEIQVLTPSGIPKYLEASMDWVKNAFGVSSLVAVLGSMVTLFSKLRGG